LLLEVGNPSVNIVTSLLIQNLAIRVKESLALKNIIYFIVD
jgi:hypothetical protein